MEQKNYKFQDVCEIVTDYVANGSFKSLADNVQYSDKKDYARLIRLVDFNNNYDEKNAVWVPESSYNFLKKSVLYGDEVIISNVGANLGTVFKCPKLTYPMTLGPNSLLVRTNDLCNQNYLYYYLKSKIGYSKLMALVSGSAMPKFNKTELRNMEISLPDRAYQDKAVEVLIKIDKKIELNNKINNNLEEQLRLFFEEDILKKLNNENTYECSLYDQFDVIDNRGKTPPLVEYSKYPIIDVKVLSGIERVINYNNCLKYVSKETYDTFFRSGHPKLYDTLLSTVGSLAELKIYLENIGTIAQNVVALRPKNDYPLFMYQYILSLKQRLTSYDIGSVQPSIKVTQFMKEIIKIPKDKDLIYKFENLANANTFKMKNLMMENRYLEQLRDALLPKLMNGEIDLDNIEI